MTAEPTRLSRRRWLAGLATCTAWALHPTAHAHQSPGPVTPPRLVPDLTLTGANTRALSLRHALLGHVTALQLMFTGCSATCPIQGAVFGSVQQRLAGADAGLRLLSVSIDPLGDDPQALRAWLHRFDADSRHWSAGILRPADVDRFQDFTRGRASGVDRHTPQVYIFNRQAELVFRTLDLPSGEQIVDVLRQVSRFV
jgi:protein SCO1/2